MKKLKICFIIASIVQLIFFATESLADTANTNTTQSDKKNVKNTTDTVPPPEAPSCPTPLTLKDGFYIGFAAGYDSYRAVGQVTGDDDQNTFFVDADGDAFSFDSRESANGAVGGAFVGYGKYFSDYHNTYVALEGFGNPSAAITDYELFLNSPAANPTTKDIYYSKFHVKNNFGISFLPGIKLNDAALFYLRFGLSWSKIEVQEVYNDDGTRTKNVKESNVSSGFNYGLGVETTFYENWSVRADFNHTQYDEFDTDLGTVFSPANSQYMLGLIYHFA